MAGETSPPVNNSSAAHAPMMSGTFMGKLANSSNNISSKTMIANITMPLRLLSLG